MLVSEYWCIVDKKVIFHVSKIYQLFQDVYSRWLTGSVGRHGFNTEPRRTIDSRVVRDVMGSIPDRVVPKTHGKCGTSWVQYRTATYQRLTGSAGRHGFNTGPRRTKDSREVRDVMGSIPDRVIPKTHGKCGTSWVQYRTASYQRLTVSAGRHGFNTGPRRTKDVIKMVSDASLLSTQQHS